MSLPALGDALPKRGTWFSRGLGRAVLKIMGWRFEGAFPNVPKFVGIVAPHTSNWDFIIGMAVVVGSGLDAHWIGKHTIFRPPFGGFMRWLGGMPVNRSETKGAVPQIVEIFDEREQLIIGIAPEGTRKRVDRWKTGFYHIALGAKVPILLAYFDYPRKVVGIGPTIMPSGDLEADMKTIRAFFADFVGKYPHQG